MSASYDIEADWSLMTTCNFRCAYCFHSNRSLGAKIAPPASAEKLTEFFDNSGMRWHLHLTGGEPFHYPDFLELCERLTKRHVISINSNVDSPKVLKFVERINPDRVDFMNCAVHLQQRTQRKRLPHFIDHVTALRTSGFDAYVTSVMYPEVFPLFRAHWDLLASKGVMPWPKAFRGDYDGKRYPDAYNDAERALITEYSKRAEAFYADQFSLRDDRPTIDPVIDREVFLQGIPHFRGRQCAAGHDLVRINGRGDIYRCGGNTRLGNIVTGEFRRMAPLSPCNDHFCPYYCTKYSIAPPTNRTGKPARRTAPIIELIPV
ncbi:MAG: radical SAM protein [Xanthomonadales bacterium]|nr:radical SAM protein [Xanthomonadales bacterium]